MQLMQQDRMRSHPCTPPIQPRIPTKPFKVIGCDYFLLYSCCYFVTVECLSGWTVQSRVKATKGNSRFTSLCRAFLVRSFQSPTCTEEHTRPCQQTLAQIILIDHYVTTCNTSTKMLSTSSFLNFNFLFLNFNQLKMAQYMKERKMPQRYDRNLAYLSKQSRLLPPLHIGDHVFGHLLLKTC